MSYCTVDDVASALPFFQRNQPGSISDAQIQGWIDDRKARIRAALLARGIDPDALTLSTDQANWLRALNRDGAIADLYDALAGASHLQPSEAAIAGRHARAYEGLMAEVTQGLHDRLFSTLAKTLDIKPGLAGTGGAETRPGETADDRGENRSFSKDQVF